MNAGVGAVRTHDQTRMFAGRYAAIADDDDPVAILPQPYRVALEPAPLPKPETVVMMNFYAYHVANGEPADALQLVNLALTLEPERADYWMMRFHLLRTLERGAEFSGALQIAWCNPVLVRKLDVRALRRMWNELCRWKPLPDGVSLPEETNADPAADRATRQLRFNELAQRIATQPLAELRQAYSVLRRQPLFACTFARRIAPLLQRPTPLQFAQQLSAGTSGRTRVFLKREDTRHVTLCTDNAIAQAYLAAALGRREIIAGNDEDEHSLALAKAAHGFSLQCTILLDEGEADAKPDLLRRLRLLGARVCTSHGLPMETDDPHEAALRLWLQRPNDAHLAMLSGLGPEPYPAMSTDFRTILGHEAELQLRAQAVAGRPRAFIAARYSKADGIGLMLPQLLCDSIKIFFAEPVTECGALSLTEARAECHSARRLHARLRSSGRAQYVAVTDDNARRAQDRAFRLEGVRLSLEDARAAAFAMVMVASHTTDLDIVALAA